jgi:hypothetical protein
LNARLGQAGLRSTIVKGDGVLACENESIDEIPQLWGESKQWRIVHGQRLSPCLDIADSIDEEHGDMVTVDGFT